MINLKLFINRDISTSDICFVISDELGKEKYNAVIKKSRHNVPKSTIKLDIVDGEKIVVAKIRKLPVVGVSSFSLKTQKSVATLVIVNSVSGMQCRFYGNNWRLCGDLASKNFSIIDVDNAVICCQRKTPLYCELEITNSENELTALLAALCVNMVNTVDKLAVQTV